MLPGRGWAEWKMAGDEDGCLRVEMAEMGPGRQWGLQVGPPGKES